MTLITAKSILQLTLLIFAGFAAYKLKLIKHEHLDSVNAILLHLSLPALLLRSFQLDVLFNSKDILLPALGFSALTQILSLLLAFMLVRKSGNAIIERASIAFTNNAFVAIPLLSSIFGDIGSFYGCAFNAISSLCFFSVLPAMISGQLSAKECFIKTFNDKFITCVSAIILLVLNIRIPEFIMTPIGWIADMTTPIAMIIIGCIIAYSDFGNMFNPRVMWITFLRLSVVPLIICLLFIFIIHEDTMLLSFCILASTPTASLVTIYAEQSNKNASLSSGIFLMTTVVSAVSIPLIIMLVNMIK